MVVTRDDKRDLVFHEELVKAVSRLAVAVQPVAAYHRIERFVQEDKLVTKRSLQLGFGPGELFSRYSRLLSGKLRAQKDKKSIPLRKRVVGFRKELEKDP